MCIHTYVLIHAYTKLPTEHIFCLAENFFGESLKNCSFYDTCFTMHSGLVTQFRKAFSASSFLVQVYRLVSPILFICFPKQFSYSLYCTFALLPDNVNSKTTIVSIRAVTSMTFSI